MNKSTFITVEEYSDQNNLSAEDVIQMIKDGRINSHVVDDVCYVNPSDAKVTNVASQKANNAKTRNKNTTTEKYKTRATQIMLAAAHLDTRAVKKELEKRQQSPYKAQTPEYGIDIDLITEETNEAKDKLNFQNLLFFVSAVVGFFGVITWVVESDSYNGDTTPGVLMVLTALLVCTLADFSYISGAKKRARKHLNEADQSHQNGLSIDTKQNVIISGGFSPFVGSGIDSAGWSFTVNLEKADDETSPVNKINLEELYSKTEASLSRVFDKTTIIKDEIFIDGRDVKQVDSLLPNGEVSKPVFHYPNNKIDDLVNHNDEQIRRYKVVRNYLWKGTMVVSVYYRFVIKQNTLYAESRVFLLLPLLEKYMNYEKMTATSNFRENISTLMSSLFKSPFLMVYTLFKALIFINGGFAKHFANFNKINRKQIEEDRQYNYGWEKSLRETWSSAQYNRYFQLIDKDFSVKMINEALLDSLEVTLKNKNISTESFKGATAKIFNEGIILNGGNIKADNITVGDKAKTVANTIMKTKSS